MDSSKKQISFVYVVRGASIPPVPLEFRGAIHVSQIQRPGYTDEEVYFFENIAVNVWDIWAVVGAVAGFCSKDRIRLKSGKFERCLTWIRNTDTIYGISDYGPIRGNYKLCNACGKIMGQRKTLAQNGGELFNRGKYDAIEYRCTNCSHHWIIEKTDGRPRKCKNKKETNRKPEFRRRRDERQIRYKRQLRQSE